ncbi:hypothetical protein [Achromobacter sp. Bel]|uniref:hypothetical protein n=1 Tax=Achromobacter sp. Bel TaxID=2727415 RepID=UPI00145E3311|nr:hypothetical protein [Achromobacter sp. Bel]NMK46449.1 hypothetical protein [Achromobacter sp. Bel]
MRENQQDERRVFARLNKREHRFTSDVHKSEHRGGICRWKAGWHAFFPRLDRLPILANAAADPAQA